LVKVTAWWDAPKSFEAVSESGARTLCHDNKDYGDFLSRATPLNWKSASEPYDGHRAVHPRALTLRKCELLLKKVRSQIQRAGRKIENSIKIQLIDDKIL
jgi:hypothetical protein